MEPLVRDFLEANRGKPKIILLGEDHGGKINDDLIENVGKESLVMRVAKTFGEPIVMYHEVPRDQLELLKRSPMFVAHYVVNEATRLGVEVIPSNVDAKCRKEKGSCDDIYRDEILDCLKKSKTVVAVLGLLHAAEIEEIPPEVSVLRLNCTSMNNTNYTMNEIARLRKSKDPYSVARYSLLEIRLSRLPYIKDSESIDIGRTIVGNARSESGSYGEDDEHYEEGPAAAGAPVGTYKPIWLKNKFNDWVIQCPLCKNISGTLLQLTHNYNCPNKGKTPDLSEKPAGGNRKTRKYRKKTYRRRISRKNKSIKKTLFK